MNNPARFANLSYMETLLNFLKVDSIGSIIVRAVIWLIIVTIFAFGASEGQKHSTIKAEAGFFLAFIVLTGVTIFFAFGFIPTLTN